MLQTVQVTTMGSTSSSDREMLTVKDVSLRLDVHEQTVRRLIRTRKLRAIRIGRLVKVPREAVALFLRSNVIRREPS
jgi:excisionase family DNA binding protein